MTAVQQSVKHRERTVLWAKHWWYLVIILENETWIDKELTNHGFWSICLSVLDVFDLQDFIEWKDRWLTMLRWSAIIGWTSFRTFVIAVRRPSLWCILWRWHRTSTGIRLWCGQADAQEGSGVSRYKKLLKHLKRIQKALEHKCHHKSTQLGTKTFEFLCFFQAHSSFFVLQPSDAEERQGRQMLGCQAFFLFFPSSFGSKSCAYSKSFEQWSI